MLDYLLSPFEFTFIQQAMLVAMLIAIPSAIISCMLVLKGWSLMGDAISHSVLPGVVLAYAFSIPYIIGAFFTGMLCAVTTGYIKNNSRLKEDTIMGIVFSSFFALGLVLMSKIESGVHLDHILFGDILGLSWATVMESTLVSLGVLCFLLLKGKDLLVYIFDYQHGKAIGLPVEFLHYALLAVLSLTIVASLKVVGMILVIALLIAPGAIAFLLTKQFQYMVGLAIVIALLCSTLGIYLSFFINSAPAPTIIVIMSGLFLSVFIYQAIRPSRLTIKPKLVNER